MKKILTFLSVITFSLISCKNEAETKEIQKVIVPFYQVNNQQQTATTPQPKQNPLYQGNSNQTQSAPVAVAKGMNPAHGQPGHRCDIPVGAPLSTQTTNNTSTNSPVASNPGMTVSTPIVSTAKAQKGMNPAHGQPGHRCDIPVGAPLNSPVASTKTTAPQIVSNTNAAPVQTQKGMNPPHGQPGHRCDIAVGAPLSSPVADTKAATTQTGSNYNVTMPPLKETPAETPPSQ